MVKFEIGGAFQIIDVVVYNLLLVLGFYLIYEGEVIQRFSRKRTNFAEFDEKVAEFPTIITSIDDLPNRHDFKFREHFDISYGTINSDQLTNLTFGENLVAGSKLVVDMESIGNGHYYKITPLNSGPDMPLSYRLQYTFKNSTGVSAYSKTPPPPVHICTHLATPP